MKKNTLLIFLLAFWFNKAHGQIFRSFIELKAVNGQNHNVPLFISTTEIEIPINELDTGGFYIFRLAVKKMGKIMTEQIKKDYFKTLYDSVVTNFKTYSTTMSFLEKNKKYYCFEENLNNYKNIEFRIYTANKTYLMYTDTLDDFFRKLIAYLKLNNCDQRVIASLREIRW